MNGYEICHYCGSIVDTYDSHSECFPESNIYYCDDNCYRKEEKRDVPEDIKSFDENYKE